MNGNDHYKQGIKAYRKGCAWGVFVGLVVCVSLKLPVYTLPVVLGLLIGAITFRLRLRKIEKK